MRSNRIMSQAPRERAEQMLDEALRDLALAIGLADESESLGQRIAALTDHHQHPRTRGAKARVSADHERSNADELLRAPREQDVQRELSAVHFPPTADPLPRQKDAVRTACLKQTIPVPREGLQIRNRSTS